MNIYNKTIQSLLYTDLAGHILLFYLTTDLKSLCAYDRLDNRERIQLGLRIAGVCPHIPMKALLSLYPKYKDLRFYDKEDAFLYLKSIKPGA